MKKTSLIVILIVVVIIIAVVGFVAYPAFATSTLKIKYISGGTNPMNPSESDGISHGGDILICIDPVLPNYSLNPHQILGTYHADQSIIVSGLSIGKHSIEIWRGPLYGYNLLAGKDVTSYAAILGDTVVDLHFAEGFQ